MRARIALCCCLLLACGEGAKDPGARPENAAEVQPPQDEGERALAAAPDPKCEPSAHLEELDWLPDSRLALLVAVEDEGLQATLEGLTSGQLEVEPPLPVFAAFELQNLALELRTLAMVYEALGLEPAQLLKTHGPKKESVWVLPAPCDHAALEARASARWKVQFRGDGATRIGMAPADAALPFDLLLMPGGRMVLVPRGHAGAVQRWLSSGASTPSSLTGSPAASGPSPGSELSTLPPAPLRVRLSGNALGGSAAGRQLLTLAPGGSEAHETTAPP